MNALADVDQTLEVRAVANKWISDNFPTERRFLGHTSPVRHDTGWLVDLLTWHGDEKVALGKLAIVEGTASLVDLSRDAIVTRLTDLIMPLCSSDVHEDCTEGDLYRFACGDGIEGARRLDDNSVDLLLTDPPYGISSPYTCEQQVPRRLRKDGRDFIMPRGHFGDWDDSFPSPRRMDCPKCFRRCGDGQSFSVHKRRSANIAICCRRRNSWAVGTLVWQKTNPVPFNHKWKPINAWEAIVIGKRPGTKFNGHVVHNVFVHKSPSPQKRIHPTQKPEALIAEFIGLFSDPVDFVLDPFAGSATTVVCAVQAGRRVLAFENDATHYRAAAQRIRDVDSLV